MLEGRDESADDISSATDAQLVDRSCGVCQPLYRPIDNADRKGSKITTTMARSRKLIPRSLDILMQIVVSNSLDAYVDTL